MSRKKTLIACAAVLGAAVVLTALIFATEPTAERGGALRESAMLVEATAVEYGTFRPTIRALGTVEPAQDVVLSPRVSGEVVRLASSFAPGGYVRRGEVLLQVDPADYDNVLQQRLGDLSQALADLDVERGRQAVARQDYALLGDSLTGGNESLVLRQPQLGAARARVEAARAAVGQARLALERTTLRAPFDAHILRRGAALGSQVAPGDDLGRLVGVDTYWVVATVPVAALRWLAIPQSGETRGSAVRVRDRTGWPDGQWRRGYVYRLVGALEQGTRMARVLLAIPDPLGYGEAAGAPPLMIGAYVEAEIEAEPLEGVVRLRRELVRGGETVWVMEDSLLSIRDVDIVFEDPDYAYVAGGLGAQDRVVTTNLATVVDGARLRLAGEASDAPPQTLPPAAP